jgi:hypothetical protein
MVAAARRGGRDTVGCIILGRGEDDQNVRSTLGDRSHGSRVHRFPRGPHELLGTTGEIASQQENAGDCHW